MNLDEIVAEQKIRVKDLRSRADYQSEEDLCDIADMALDSLQDVLGIHKEVSYELPVRALDNERGAYKTFYKCRNCQTEFPCPTRQAISNRLEETK
jgi:hypothetical protein